MFSIPDPKCLTSQIISISVPSKPHSHTTNCRCPLKANQCLRQTCLLQSLVTLLKSTPLQQSDGPHRILLPNSLGSKAHKSPGTNCECEGHCWGEVDKNTKNSSHIDLMNSGSSSIASIGLTFPPGASCFMMLIAATTPNSQGQSHQAALLPVLFSIPLPLVQCIFIKASGHSIKSEKPAF